MFGSHDRSNAAILASLFLILSAAMIQHSKAVINGTGIYCEMPIDTLLYQNWESGIGNWWVDNGLWDVGVPGAGPGSAFSGTKCAGTVLDGSYSPSANTRLISPNILLPGLSEGEQIRLRFWQWFQIAEDNYYGYDKGFIQISVNNGEWQTLLGPISGISRIWSPVIVDLSAYADSTIKIGFQFLSGSLVEDIGWYVDDIELAVAPVHYNDPEDFEQGIGDWWVDNGLWEVGLPVVGPDAAHSGQNCAGTFLSGSYPGQSNTRLISPEITLTQLPGQYPGLYFWHWFRIAESAYYGNDHGYVQISVGGGDWITIGGPFSGISEIWSQSYVDLYDYIDSTIRIAFYFTSGTLVDDIGWYVDDIRIEGIIADVGDGYDAGLPGHFGVSQNFPNPFNPSTNISYRLTKRSDVTIEIFNITGQKIKILIDENKPAGEYRLTWDGHDSDGNHVPTGIYFYRLQSGDFVETRKMILLK